MKTVSKLKEFGEGMLSGFVVGMLFFGLLIFVDGFVHWIGVGNALIIAGIMVIAYAVYQIVQGIRNY